MTSGMALSWVLIGFGRHHPTHYLIQFSPLSLLLFVFLPHGAHQK